MVQLDWDETMLIICIYSRGSFCLQYATYLSDTNQLVNKHVLDLPHLPCHAGYNGSVADGSAQAKTPQPQL